MTAVEESFVPRVPLPYVHGAFFMRLRRTFDSADAARHDMLVNWALKAGVGRDQGGANWREVGNDADDEGGFADRMEDIRRRLLEVFDLDGKTVEVRTTR